MVHWFAFRKRLTGLVRADATRRWPPMFDLGVYALQSCIWHMASFVGHATGTC